MEASMVAAWVPGTRPLHRSRQLIVRTLVVVLALLSTAIGPFSAPAGASSAPSVDAHPICPDPSPGIGSPCPAISPVVVAQGTPAIVLAVHGSGFGAAGSTITVWFGSSTAGDDGITVSAVAVDDDTLLHVTVSVSATAPFGGAIIHVENSAGSSFCSACGPLVVGNPM